MLMLNGLICLCSHCCPLTGRGLVFRLVLEQRWRWTDWALARELTASLHWLLVALIRRQSLDMAQKQGLGRHGWDEQRRLAEQDVQALSALLGDASRWVAVWWRCWCEDSVG